MTMSLKTITFSARAVFRSVNRGVIAPQQQLRIAGLRKGTVRFYYGTAKPTDPAPAGSAPCRTVDLRSDTVTKPGAAMRQAMAEAEVGDDVFGEDPTINELQHMAAGMFGMEAALFVPSGTMSNLIAVMVHCRERGDEMIVGDLSHLHIYEQGGSAQLAGVHATTVTNLPDGTFHLDELESKIRHGYPDPHYPRSRLVCVENTHNIQGGRVLPLSFLQEVRVLAERYGLAVHMDGARVMNAAVTLGVPPATILQHTHTVSVCLSKVRTHTHCQRVSVQGSGCPCGDHAGGLQGLCVPGGALSQGPGRGASPGGGAGGRGEAGPGGHGGPPGGGPSSRQDLRSSPAGVPTTLVPRRHGYRGNQHLAVPSA
ncbi:threonine aldolase 1 isoform X2 [Osmerus eperlanus]|uniref:threonine aldolase 1 isoform X2 n=1 Tax=Osmerus eperlanus TaxID=29151 RepID=UPI002E15F575